MISMVSDYLARMSEHAGKSQRGKYIFELKKAAVTSILGALSAHVGCRSLTSVL